MLAGSFLPLIIVLALGGSLAGKELHAPTRATMPTSGFTFARPLLGVIVVLGGLTYRPGLVHGPVAEHLAV